MSSAAAISTAASFLTLLQPVHTIELGLPALESEVSSQVSQRTDGAILDILFDGNASLSALYSRLLSAHTSLVSVMESTPDTSIIACARSDFSLAWYDYRKAVAGKYAMCVLIISTDYSTWSLPAPILPLGLENSLARCDDNVARLFELLSRLPTVTSTASPKTRRYLARAAAQKRRISSLKAAHSPSL